MAVRRPRPEYLSVRSSRTLDPLVAVREDPVETVATRTLPSAPGKTESILPSRHSFEGKLSSLMTTRSPTRRFSVGTCH